MDIPDHVIVGDNEYTHVQEIGHGGIAKVYSALNRRGKKVTLKVYEPNVTDVLIEKIRSALSLRRQHKEIPKELVVEPVSDDLQELVTVLQTQRAAVFNHIRGWDIRALNPSSRPIENRIRGARELILKVMPILELLIKSGLVHDDVKPENLICSPDGQIAFIDIDLFTTVDHPLPSSILGTPLFYSPEQCRGEVSATTDVFGLGASVLYEFMDTTTTIMTGMGLESDFDLDRTYCMARRESKPLTKLPRAQHALLNLDRFPEGIRMQAHGLLMFLIASLHPDPKARPKTLEEAKQLLRSQPNHTMHYGTVVDNKTLRKPTLKWPLRKADLEFAN